MRFEAGNKYAPGGTRRGAGAKPNWLREHCREIVQEHHLVEFLAAVASGKAVETVLAENGKRLQVPARTKVRLDAIELLLDRAYGKATIPVEYSEKQPYTPFDIRIVEAKPPEASK